MIMVKKITAKNSLVIKSMPVFRLISIQIKEMNPISANTKAIITTATSSGLTLPCWLYSSNNEVFTKPIIGLYSL